MTTPAVGKNFRISVVALYLPILFRDLMKDGEFSPLEIDAAATQGSNNERVSKSNRRHMNQAMFP